MDSPSAGVSQARIRSLGMAAGLESVSTQYEERRIMFMKKVVIFNGSPRFDGNTATICNMIERGAKEHNAQVNSYTLFKLKMSACQGCFGCRINDGKCSLSDELTKAIEQVKEADAVVIGSPIYFMQINGMVKNLYDRMFPLLGNDGRPRCGEKQIVTVYTQEMDDPHMHDSYFDFLAGTMFPGFGFVNEKRIVCTNANNPQSADDNRELMQQAYNVGREIATA
jgi:multimeric flavodoxin WrbA